MTREEFDTLLTQAADPNQTALALSQIREGVGELFNSNENLSQQVAESNDTIAQLRQTNMQLFLRIGGQAPEEEEKEETLEEMDERLRKML